MRQIGKALMSRYLMANSKRRCINCKKHFPPESGIVCNIGFICSNECRIEYALNNTKKLINKTKKDISKKNNIEKKEFYKNSLPKQRELTQKTFNRMRVLQEKLWFKERGLPVTCISCGKELGGDIWACGHFKTRGGYPELALDEKNSFIQHNRRCNQGLSGDIEGSKSTHGYKAGLKIRFGETKGQEIIDYCESYHPPKNWTCEQYIEFRKECLVKIKELQKLIE